MSRIIALLVLAACHSEPQYPADVKLEIEGQRYDYTTTKVEWEREGDGPISVYLLPEDKTSGQPYLNLRYYSGNPVGHVWLRYTKDAEEFEHPPKYECYVPGRLRDGTETLTWRNDDGSERHSTETGEEGCRMTVEELGDGRLNVEFDLELTPKDKKNKADEATGEAIVIRAHGSAEVGPR